VLLKINIDSSNKKKKYKKKYIYTEIGFYNIHYQKKKM